MEIFKVAALEQKYRNGELGKSKDYNSYFSCLIVYWFGIFLQDGATVIFINDTNDIGDSLSDIEGCDGV